jgi:hypothetical protein
VPPPRQLPAALADRFDRLGAGRGPGAVDVLSRFVARSRHAIRTKPSP